LFFEALNVAMPPTGGIRPGEAAFIKAFASERARPRPAAGWNYRGLEKREKT